MPKKKKGFRDKVTIKGFYRLNIEEGGKIVGDSGWIKNVITNEGFDDYLVRLIGDLTSSKQISYVALGTGGAVATNATQLTGEIMGSTQRKIVSDAMTASNSTRLAMQVTFASSDNFVSDTYAINNIGLYDSSNAGTLFAGNSYTASTVDTNQNVNVTYNVNFS